MTEINLTNQRICQRRGANDTVWSYYWSLKMYYRPTEFDVILYGPDIVDYVSRQGKIWEDQWQTFFQEHKIIEMEEFDEPDPEKGRKFVARFENLNDAIMFKLKI